MDKLTIDLPPELVSLCERNEITPEMLIKGFVADLCGLENTPDPLLRNHGSNEREAARGWFNSVMWPQTMKESE